MLGKRVPELQLSKKGNHDSASSRSHQATNGTCLLPDAVAGGGKQEQGCHGLVLRCTKTHPKSLLAARATITALRATISAVGLLSGGGGGGGEGDL